MRTQGTGSGVAVSRLTLTCHLRPIGRLRTPVWPGAVTHAATARFLHQGLHLRPEPPLRTATGRPREPSARPARFTGRRLDNRRAGVLTLCTGHDRLHRVKGDRPACRWTGVLRTPLQQRQGRDIRKQAGARSPVGGTWDSCSIVNAATPRSVATDPRGRGFPAPYQTFLRKGEQT